MILTTPSHGIHHCTFLLARAFFSSVRIQNRLSSYAFAMQAKTNEKSYTFTVKLPLPKQITRGPLSMDPQVLGFIAVYIYLSDLAFCVPETFHAKFPVLVKSVFKIVTRALPLRPTPNHPATSKLRDRRRICLFFKAKGELRGRARSESVSLAHSMKLPNKLTGATPHATKKPQTPRVGFSVFISCF